MFRKLFDKFRYQKENEIAYENVSQIKYGFNQQVLEIKTQYAPWRTVYDITTIYPAAAKVPKIIDFFVSGVTDVVEFTFDPSDHVKIVIRDSKEIVIRDSKAIIS